MKRDLATRVNSVTVHIGRALRRPEAGEALAAEHRSALGVVYFAGPIRMGTLAAAERVGAPAMTRTVGILERAGLVRRETDSADSRAVRIHTTAKGARFVSEGRDERVRRIAAALRRMPRPARARLAAAVGDLEALITELERAGRQRPKAR